MYILAHHYDDLDLDYMLTVNKGAESLDEVKELEIWLKELKDIKKKLK